MNPKLQKFLSWLIPLIAIVGLFLGIQYFSEKRKGPGFPESAPTVNPNFPTNLNPQAAEELLTDEEIQEQIQVASERRDSKMMANALKSGNTQDCQPIAQVEKRQECEDYLNYAPLLKKNDPSQCQMLHSPTLEQACLDNIAFQKALESKNRKQCEVIVDAVLKTRCLDEVYFYLAQTSTNPSDCETITSPTQKTLCRDQMELKTAISQNQKELCSEIESQTLKDQCLNTIENNQLQAEKAQAAQQEVAQAEVPFDSLQRCELMVGEAKEKCEDEAYFQAAYDQKNLILCNQIHNEEKQTRCRSEQQAAIDQYYYKLAISSQSSEECWLIVNEEVEKICLANVK